MQRLYFHPDPHNPAPTASRSVQRRDCKHCCESAAADRIASIIALRAPTSSAQTFPL
jgi:hypothetical protein